MQLTVYNGSPRGSKGNSVILLNKFLEGFQENDEKIEINHLISKGKMREFVGKFQNAENIIIVFPLYADSMPGIVMEFFENLENMKLYPEKQKIGFIIHCGFPDAIHLKSIEKYLEKLSRRLGIDYIGTIVKPGSEGLRVTPEKINKKLYRNINALGRKFRQTGEFDKILLQKIKAKEKFHPAMISLLKLLNKAGLFNIWWNKQLKNNNAFADRFAKPFEMKKP